MPNQTPSKSWTPQTPCCTASGFGGGRPKLRTIPWTKPAALTDLPTTWAEISRRNLADFNQARVTCFMSARWLGEACTMSPCILAVYIIPAIQKVHRHTTLQNFFEFLHSKGSTIPQAQKLPRASKFFRHLVRLWNWSSCPPVLFLFFAYDTLKLAPPPPTSPSNECMILAYQKAAVVLPMPHQSLGFTMTT